MRIILDATFDNDDLPVVDPLYSLVTADMLAGYAMQTTLDFSPHARHMTYAGGFNSAGAACNPAVPAPMMLPITEQDEMTAFVCLNVAGQGANSLVFGNGDASVSPYRGARLYHGSTNATYQVANGAAWAQTSFNLIGAWTVRCLRWNATTAQSMNHGGTKVNINGTLAHAKGTGPFYANGAPSGDVTNGLNGTLGMLLFYQGWMADADAISTMDTIATIMAERGVMVP